MVFSVLDVVSGMCTLLAIVCASEVLITGILTFLIPHFLTFTETQVPTFAGIMAGFVTVPTILRIKTSKSAPHIDRVFGYTVCFQRLAVVVCAALHFSAALVSIIAVFTTKSMVRKMIKLMRKYHCKLYAKELVDNIQLSLQCCGARQFRDWYKIDWGGFHFDASEEQHSNNYYEVLKTDTDVFPDMATVRKDHVPYSCCARKVMTPCVHQNLLHLGTNTINNEGCGPKLFNVVLIILWTQFSIYLFCLILEILIMALLKPAADDLQCLKLNNDKKAGAHMFSRFENAETEPQITPSSHSEVTVASAKLTSTTYPNTSISTRNS